MTKVETSAKSVPIPRLGDVRREIKYGNEHWQAYTGEGKWEDIPGVVNLATYIIVPTEHSTCPACDQPVFLLAPRALNHQVMPFYYLCRCGQTAQAGSVTPVALSERSRR